LIIRGDLYRLATPDKSNWPAFMYMSRDGQDLVLLAYQILNRVNNAVPAVRLQGLDPHAEYSVENGETYTGDTLMNVGLKFAWKGDHNSRVLFLHKHS
jgi:alpha-galactosidase